MRKKIVSDMTVCPSEKKYTELIQIFKKLKQLKKKKNKKYTLTDFTDDVRYVPSSWRPHTKWRRMTASMMEKNDCQHYLAWHITVIIIIIIIRLWS